jgi:hypothetical protein
MEKEAATMPQRATVTVRADALPPEYAALIRPRPLPSDMVEVTLAVKEPTPEQWLANARAGIDKGRAEIDAGLGIDGDAVFAELKQAFCK